MKFTIVVIIIIINSFR